MSTSRNFRTAFSLIEVTLALGIAAFCLLTVFGLLPIGLTSSQNSAEETVVAGIATAISADFHGVTVLSSTGATTSRFQFYLPQADRISYVNPSTQVLYFGGDGSPSGSVDENASVANSPAPRYRATIVIRADKTIDNITSQSAQDTLYKIWILITWPALSDANYKLLPSNFAGSFETVTALNFYNN